MAKTKKPRIMRVDGPCTICHGVIIKGAVFKWHNFPTERAAGRSGMAHPACITDAPASAANEAVGLTGEAITIPNGASVELRLGALESAVDGIATQITADVAPEVEARLDTLEALAKMFEASKSTTVVIKKPDAPEVVVEHAHAKLPEALNALAVWKQVYLWGPAGSGKTTMGKQAATALDVPFYYVQVGRAPEFKLVGYPTASGGIFETDFRRAYINGGVVLLDELDATAPETAITLNGAIENGRCAFPDGQQSRHPDCYIMGTGNTPMLGADEDYSARSVQDSAFRERFAFIRVDLDLGLEETLTRAKGAVPTLTALWLEHVRSLRERLAKIAPHILVTPRASIRGAEMLQFDHETTFSYLTELLILKGAAPEGSDVRAQLAESGLL